MIERGKVTNVWVSPIGSELVADAASGQPVLVVDDAYDFNPTGGSLRLIKDDGTATDLSYTSADVDNDTITLTANLGATYVTGTQVRVLPLGVQKKVQVDLSDQDEGPVALAGIFDSLLDDGIRDPNDQEAALIDDSSGRWEISAIDDQQQVVLGSQINPTDLPTTIPTVPPTASPAIKKVSGTSASLVVETDGVNPGTLINYYVSTVDGFVPGPSTLFTTTQSQVAIINKLPGGLALDKDTQYYVVVLATNAAGSAPTYSAQVSGKLDLSQVDSLVAARLVAGFILAGTISVGQMTIDADTGITINGAGGVPILRFPVDGISPLQLTAQVVAQTLTVQDKFTIAGSGVVNADLLLAAGVSTPAVAPTLSTSTPTIDTDLTTGNTVYDFGGAVEDPANSAYVLVPDSDGLLNQVYRINKTTGAIVNKQTLTMTQGPSVSIQAITYSSVTGKFFVIFQDFDRTFSNPSFYMARFSNTFVQEAEFQIGGSGAFNGRQMRLVSDGTNPGMVWIPNAASLMLRWYNPNMGGGTIGADVTLIASLSGTGQGVGGAYYGNADVGSARLFVNYLGPSGSTTIFCFNPASSYAQDTARNFIRVNRVQGLFWDSAGGQLMTMDDQANLTRYSKYQTAVTIQAKYSWYDGNATGSTHRSLPSPVATLAVPARRYVSVIADVPPGFYDTDPAHTDKANQVKMYVSDDGGTTWHMTVLTASPWGQTVTTFAGIATETPPVTNEFSGITLGSVGTMRSQTTDSGVDGMTEVVNIKGFGPWRLGNYGSVRHFGSRYHNTTQAIATATTTLLQWNSAKEAATGLTWDAANNRFVIAKPGIYLVSISLEWLSGGSGTGHRSMAIRKNGAAYMTSDMASAAFTTAGPPTQLLIGMIPCAIGDTLDVTCWQNTGSTMSIGVAGGDQDRHHFDCGFMAQ